jgi:hypothetical protein
LRFSLLPAALFYREFSIPTSTCDCLPRIGGVVQYSRDREDHLEILASVGISKEAEKQEAGLAHLSSQGAELGGEAIPV